MTRTVYVNGEYLPEDEATVSIFDRSFLMADGVYEVTSVLGGKLIQHIPDTIENALAHEQPNPRDEAGHRVAIQPGTRLHEIVGTDTLDVNSAHHQAALGCPGGVLINARAPDGVIEGIEATAYRFCLGVQWHPEFDISDGDGKIIRAFVEAAGSNM